MDLLKAVCSLKAGRSLVRKMFSPQHSSRSAFGLSFRNSVGLGAGFDKNALYLRELEAIGFGFIEIGTVTPRPQEGNPRPRLFRLPKDRALINRMGFNNHGVEAIRDRLKAWREKEQHPGFLVGGNIGKNKDTANEDAWKDYETCFRELHPYVDFFVVNVSSPNTPGLRALQEKPALQKILTHLQQINRQQPVQRPILLKIAPDLETEQVDDVIELAREIQLDGLVATNTTISRKDLKTDPGTLEKIGAGGLSGLPVRQRSTEVLQHIYSKTGGAIPVIGSGGIFGKEDAEQKTGAGATLIEVWTGFIYTGPSIVKNIVR